MKRRTLQLAVGVTAASVALALVVFYQLAAGSRPPGESYQLDTASESDLATVRDLRVFFAHQSVGRNILEGVSDVYDSRGIPAPKAVDVSAAEPDDPLIDVRVGTNGDPLGKITEFDALFRRGLGDHRDVALLKLCYSDIREDTDVDLIFEVYRDTLDQMQQDYAETTFIAATVPLTTRRSVAGTVKEWVGRGDRYGPEHNVAREHFNRLVRAEYSGPGELFDIAAIESTTADGRRETGEYDGRLYYALDESYALDPGHLNKNGAATAAEALLSLLAHVDTD